MRQQYKEAGAAMDRPTVWPSCCYVDRNAIGLATAMPCPSAAQGIPTLALDTLASASYGPEAALTVLLLAGPAASRSVVPVLW